MSVNMQRGQQLHYEKAYVPSSRQYFYSPYKPKEKNRYYTTTSYRAIFPQEAPLILQHKEKIVPYVKLEDYYGEEQHEQPTQGEQEKDMGQTFTFLQNDENQMIEDAILKADKEEEEIPLEDNRSAIPFSIVEEPYFISTSIKPKSSVILQPMSAIATGLEELIAPAKEAKLEEMDVSGHKNDVRGILLTDLPDVPNSPLPDETPPRSPEQGEVYDLEELEDLQNFKRELDEYQQAEEEEAMEGLQHLYDEEMNAPQQSSNGNKKRPTKKSFARDAIQTRSRGLDLRVENPIQKRKSSTELGEMEDLTPENISMYARLKDYKLNKIDYAIKKLILPSILSKKNYNPKARKDEKIQFLIENVPKNTLSKEFK